ncbi:hypothetical protein K491DRAFT_782222 [Lophiostoma macrostomum CBS 122681]|uniref:Mtf2-like C-terminal domain-containing protein n=1 Tax=Lophiostoma macrostomum CBS 122681 TaxID=1314788 RepID=A0A6A6SV59_9PLEO|nr:hypothetical protein K491DRAFT_782222 [Lophiostoma macrostomum CBS 122681]
MPVSRSTIGALHLSRLAHVPSSTSKTLVPFLYQTATIQQWKPAACPIAPRNISTRRTREDDIPFEDTGDLLPSIDEAASQRKTTITGSERAAFEKLYKKFSAEEQPKDDVPFAEETDQIADEWYEEDEDLEGSGESLDSVFDEVLSGLPNKKHTGRRAQQKRGHSLKRLAEDILKPEVEAAKKMSDVEARKEAGLILKLRAEERKRVHSLMEAATTDMELWQVLEREVFDPIREMKLDEEQKKPRPQTAQKRSKKKDTTAEGLLASASASASTSSSSSPPQAAGDESQDTPSTSDPQQPTSADLDKHRRDPRIAFPNFPAHLIFLARLLRASYPTSPLPFSLLPSLKSLGRAPYALGATTTLYNLIIGTAWTQYTSYSYIDELLTDMDNGGIEFNLATLTLLDEVLGEWKSLRRGAFGKTAWSIWHMEFYTEGAQKLQRWREVAARRVGVRTESRLGGGKLGKRSGVGEKSSGLGSDKMVLPDGRGGVLEFGLLRRNKPKRAPLQTHRQGGSEGGKEAEGGTSSSGKEQHVLR